MSLCSASSQSFHLKLLAIVLDGAHKYLTPNESCLNRSVADAIRSQRHLATSVMIATQDLAVISRRILNLSSFIICHRFNSLSWCTHLAESFDDFEPQDEDEWFETIRRLSTGEVIIISPKALVNGEKEGEIQYLGRGYTKVTVRLRLTRESGEYLGSYHYLEASLSG